MTLPTEDQALTEAIFSRLKSNKDFASGSKSTHLKLFIQRSNFSDESVEGLPALPSLCESKNIVYLKSAVRWNRSTLVILFQEQILHNEEPLSKISKVESEDACCKSLEAYVPLIAFKALESSRDASHPALSYIQWIDTSGLTKPRGLQSNITKALLWGYYDFLTTIDIAFVSLFATPHQDYQIGNTNSAVMSFLFKDSELNPRKKQLVGKDVAQWWLRNFYLYKKDKNTTDSQIYLFNPSNSKKDKMEYVGGDCIEYTAGLPFKLDDASSVPLFPDDPLSLHLASFMKKTTDTIDEKVFIASLALRQEYQRSVGAAHIFFQLPQGTQKDYHRAPNTDTSIEIIVDSILRNTSFKNEDDAFQSAAYLSKFLRLDTLDPFIYTYSKDCSDSVPKLVETKAVAHVNNLQSFIKRKK